MGAKLPRPALARLLVHGFVYSSDSRGDAGRSEFSASPLPGAQRGGEEARARRSPRVAPPKAAGGAGPRLRARPHARLQGALQRLSAGPGNRFRAFRVQLPPGDAQFPFFFYSKTGRKASGLNC